MSKEIIEKYIEFALKKGFNFNVKFKINNIYINPKEIVIPAPPVYSKKTGRELRSEAKCEVFNITELITSKDFISTIARGVNKTKYMGIGINITNEDIIEKITHEQAIAIRDDKLDDFITNLLNNASKPI